MTGHGALLCVPPRTDRGGETRHIKICFLGDFISPKERTCETVPTRIACPFGAGEIFIDGSWRIKIAACPCEWPWAGQDRGAALPSTLEGLEPGAS